ncbi:BON domain-containing protein [Rhodopirellula sp. SWK7]|uniref:BON domain-containing protein n=1 Tax=Rhodopirellula sp. SWK7 TaxID=595460 RepID=UPI001360B063|nr:BON domain-containing protein [Rhodopirellula sp. SWK7]
MNVMHDVGRKDVKAMNDIRRQSERIQHEVFENLASNHHSGLSRITCVYQRGILQLQGEANSYYLKQLAQERARRVDGVTHTINCIKVIDRIDPIKKAPR